MHNLETLLENRTFHRRKSRAQKALHPPTSAGERALGLLQLVGCSPPNGPNRTTGPQGTGSTPTARTLPLALEERNSEVLIVCSLAYAQARPDRAWGGGEPCSRNLKKKKKRVFARMVHYPQEPTVSVGAGKGLGLRGMETCLPK